MNCVCAWTKTEPKRNAGSQNRARSGAGRRVMAACYVALKWAARGIRVLDAVTDGSALAATALGSEGRSRRRRPKQTALGDLGGSPCCPLGIFRHSQLRFRHVGMGRMKTRYQFQIG